MKPPEPNRYAWGLALVILLSGVGGFAVAVVIYHLLRIAGVLS